MSNIFINFNHKGMGLSMQFPRPYSPCAISWNGLCWVAKEKEGLPFTFASIFYFFTLIFQPGNNLGNYSRR